jgi:hypothetical protein
MSESTVHEQALIRVRALTEKRRELLSLPPEQAMERIYSEPHPAALVHSFPEEDFYFFLHDIGVEDAGELLSLASLRQWEFILDAEIWDGDRIDLPALTRWLQRLLTADPDRLVRWAAEENSELFEYYLFKNVDLAIREHDQDPSELGDGFFTDDDFFYLRLSDRTFLSESETGLKEARDDFLGAFLKRLSACDHIRFQEMLLESREMIPAEVEEDALRLRNVRQAEKGFLPFEEAIGIYQPLNSSTLEHPFGKRSLARGESTLGFPISLYAAEMVDRDTLFSRALEHLDQAGDLEGLQSEFAGLCNQVIAADRRRVREREALREIVVKVCGYIGIGLASMVPSGSESRPAEAAGIIRRFPLDRIFRAGYGRAVYLKRRAEQWRKESWFEEQRLPLGFWGETWLGVLGGLLIKRPLYFDNYRTGDQLYREFDSVDEIRSTEQVLADVQAMDGLLSLVGIPIDPIPGKHMTWENVLLTLWVRNRLGLSEALAPIPPAEFKRWYEDIWTGRADSRVIKDSEKTDFLHWLSRVTRLPDTRLADRFQDILEALFREIEEEYGPVAVKDLDPRFVHLFLLS